MEMLVLRMQALIIRFIQRNWKQLALSLLLFVNVEMFMIVSKAVDLYQIGSTLFDVDHQEAYCNNFSWSTQASQNNFLNFFQSDSHSDCMCMLSCALVLKHLEK